MPDTTPDAHAHAHLALHPQHPSAVVATLTGSTLHTARATLASQGFRPVATDTMFLVRIDHEESDGGKSSRVSSPARRLKGGPAPAGSQPARSWRQHRRGLSPE